jgi:transcriptional regulator with XRE-family HTH domain
MQLTRYKLRRLESGTLQVVLAQKVGIDRSRLSGIENGYVTPTPDEVQRIARALTVTVADLRGGGVADEQRSNCTA